MLGFVVGGPVLAVELAQGGAALGGALGGGAGTFVGVEKALEKYDASDVNQVKNVLLQHINSTMGSMNAVIGNVTKQLQMMVTDSFDKELKQHIALLQDNYKSIQDGIKVETAEIPKQKKALKEKIQKVQAVFEKVSTLQAKIEELQMQSVRKKQPQTQSRMRSESTAASQNAEKKANKNAGENSGGQDTIDYGFM